MLSVHNNKFNFVIMQYIADGKFTYMPGKDFFSYSKGVKLISTENIRDDVLEYLDRNPSVTRESFANQAGISLRTLNELLTYSTEKGDEPNWTRKTLEGIMKVLDCEALYTPKHRMKKLQ